MLSILSYKCSSERREELPSYLPKAVSTSPSSSKLNHIVVEPTSLFHAYQRSVEVGRSRNLATSDYSKLFSVSAPDISRSDNESLARSAKDISHGFQTLTSQLPGYSETYTKELLRIAFKFAGEPQSEDVIEDIYREAFENGLPSASSSE